MLTCQKVIRVLILLALLLAPVSQANVPVSPVIQPEAQSTHTSALPLEAQTSISTVIGRDDTAYHLLPQAAADEITETYRATNSAQNLQANFTSESALLQSGNLQWDMRLRAWGRGQNLSLLEAAALQATANRVEYAYAGLTEWYINGPYGLQQGFTLQQPPTAKSNSEPLALSLDLGIYRAQLDADRKGATLAAADGSSLRYAGLLAYDADGQPLDTWLELDSHAGSSLNIRVADAGARYPITVDPLIQQAKLIAWGAAGDNFGFSVALSIDGSTALIGAYAADVVTKTAQGAAYVFVRGAATWDLQAKLTTDLGSSDGHANDRFGISVALSNDGNTALIGADQVDLNGHADQGAAYVLTRSGSTWTPQAMLVASDGAASDKLGWSVALSGNGNTALVSAHGSTLNEPYNEGAAYAFTRSGTAWSQQHKFGYGAGADYYLGYSVALSDDGNTALLGMFGYDRAGNTDQGAAVAYTRAGSTWTYENIFYDPAGAAGDLFGRSVALSDDGNTALVGASGAIVAGKDNQGAAYIFTRSAHVWTKQSRLLANDGAAGDYFGVSVALMGNGYVAYVGAYQADVSGHADQGAVYSFAKSGSTWAQAGKLTASDGYSADQFGVAVAFGGSTVLVGARGESTDQGAAYFFVPEGSGTREIKVTGSGNADDRFGTSVALSDSGNTALVGAYLADVEGKVDQGTAYVFTRSDSGWTQQFRLIASDGAANDYFGRSVALSSNGGTAIVGADRADVNGHANSGAAYVFTRVLGVWSQQAKLARDTNPDNTYLGYRVALSDDGNTALLGAYGYPWAGDSSQG
ncbi:MAG: FG-GAP repeat protein, partial [Chloroflexi bacterium]|nr:FG-GAP repeat protein [Chloroflexota bacterium]